MWSELYAKSTSFRAARSDACLQCNSSGTQHMALYIRKITHNIPIKISQNLHLPHHHHQAVQAIFSQKGSLVRCIMFDDWTTLCHFYYVYNKYFDLVDTAIFVLRKKQNQITFLHVYHHCAVIVFPTWTFHVVPGENLL